MRRLALRLVVAALALWAGAETLEGRGVLAPPVLRHLRAMKDRDTPPPTCEDLALEAFPALPVRRALAGYAPLERRGVRVEAYVRRIESSRDGDFHLKLVASPSAGAGAHYVTAEITPRWRRGSPGWSLARLAGALRAGHGDAAPPAKGPRRARLSGWLLYDVWCDALPAWVFDRGRRVNGWEIHPVTRLEVWDDSLARFVGLPRQPSTVTR